MTQYQYNPAAYQQQPPMQFVQQTQQDLNNLLLYQIKGKPAFAYADIQVQKNQRIITDGNVMLFMDSKVEEPETECWGGCMQAFCRKLAGEDCCFNTFRNDSDQNRQVSVGFNDPGDLLSFGVTPGNGWVLSEGAFVAGTDNLNVSGKFIGCCACCLSGESAFLTKVSLMEEQQQGVFLAGCMGEIVRHDIPQGKTLFVAQGLFFAAHESTKFQIGLAGGLKNLCCSGGAIVMKFYGPSVVYTQSRDPVKWNPYKYAGKNQGQDRPQGV